MKGKEIKKHLKKDMKEAKKDIKAEKKEISSAETGIKRDKELVKKIGKGKY